MNLIENIKIKIGKRMLQKETATLQRTRDLFNLTTTRTAGILYEASSVEDYELIKKFVGYLKEFGIKTKVIGYFSRKEIPEFTYSKLDYSFFNKKELNWYMKPPLSSSSSIEKFIYEEIDVLIDLNIYDYFPLKYISALSKAKFKIGQYSDENKPVYDMMIEADSSKGVKYFLRQVDIYLQMINKKEETTNIEKQNP